MDQMNLVANLGNIPTGAAAWGAAPAVTRQVQAAPAKSVAASASNRATPTVSTSSTSIGGGYPTVITRDTDPSARDVSGTTGTVLCTYFHKRKGWLPRHIWAADMKFSATLPEHMVKGYRWWAYPCVRIMLCGGWKGRLFEIILWPIVNAWAHYAAYRVGKEKTAPMSGRLVHEVLGSFSAFAGRRFG